MFACLYFFMYLFIFASHRHSLFGRNSVKTIEADLGRLYTATSLMQIDDNIMRFVLGILPLVAFTSGKFLWSKSFEEARPCFSLIFRQEISRPQLSQRVLREGKLCTLYSQCKPLRRTIYPTPAYYCSFYLVLCLCSTHGLWFSRWRCHSCWWTLQMTLWFMARCSPSLAR